MNSICTVIIGSAFPKCFDSLVASLQKNGSSFASNVIYERNLFAALSSGDDDVFFISAPPTGNFPISCQKIKSPKLKPREKMLFARYLTIIGINKFSKTYSLKKVIKDFIHNHRYSKYRIIVTELHYPYLQAASYFKMKAENSTILQIVPDLPQFCRKRTKNPIYSFLKKIDVSLIYKKANSDANAFLFFTKPMVPFFAKKPYAISPGIACEYGKKEEFTEKSIVFSGKISKDNGINLLLSAFREIDDPSVELQICGTGDEDDLVERAAEEDKRIHFFGSVPHSKALQIEKSAQILVSPRPNGVNTPYSFPSKIIEYLSLGIPIVTFHLECYPDSLQNVLLYPSQESAHQLAVCIKKALNDQTQNEQSNLDRMRFLDSLSLEETKKTIVSLFNRAEENITVKKNPFGKT